MKNVSRRNDHCRIVITSSLLTDDHIEVLKQGDTFGVFDGNGDIHSLRTGSQGLYHGGTRFLSRFELAIDGERPVLLSSSVKEDNVLLSVDLTNPSLTRDGQVEIAGGALHLSRTRFLWQGRCFERLRVITIASFPFRSGSPSQWRPTLPICSKSVGQSEAGEADGWRPSCLKMECPSGMKGWILWIGG